MFDRSRSKRKQFWAIGLLSAVACAAIGWWVVSGGPRRLDPEPAPRPLDRGAGSNPFVIPEPLLNVAIESEFNLEGLTIPRDALIRGNQPKDGIVALDDPAAIPIAEASFLTPASPVVGVIADGMARAYPIRVLSYHEFINDRLGGVNLGISYCALCGSATVIDRRLDDTTYTFGVAGLLYQSNMVLFDRTDQALWSQLTSTALSGPNAGRVLRNLPGWEVTTFEAWSLTHPDSTVIVDPTDVDEDWVDPLAEYAASDELDPRFRDLPVDPRLGSKATILGISHGGVARAYALDALQKLGRPTLHDRIGGSPLEIRVDLESRSARFTECPESAIVVQTYWFAWAARFPGTEVYGPPR